MISKKSTCRRPERRSGFTLIEMVISLTILALVVSVLYLAFSSAGRIWSRQRLKGSRGEREAALLRLLRDDLNNLVPYSYSWEKGSGFFFALGPQALFYATTSAFGARSRIDGGLYFACLYLGADHSVVDTEAAKVAEAPVDETRQALWLVKEPVPKQYLLETLQEFVRHPDTALTPDEKFRQAAVKVVGGLEEAGFAVVVNPEKLPLDDSEPDPGALREKDLVRNYSQTTLPARIMLHYRLDGNGIRRRLVVGLDVPPSLPKNKNSKNGKKK